MTSVLHPNPLAARLAHWKKCTVNHWVLKTISQGYRIQFSTKPPMSDKILFTQAGGQAAIMLREEISSLLEKGAIREVNIAQRGLGFYSHYFLAKKKGGGRRPILNLRDLNKHLKPLSFKMLTHAKLLRTVRRGDWWTSIDLKDAYHHIPIYPPHRKFLRFGFEGKVYEYTVLPFGMSLSPRVFVKITQEAIAPLRHKGIRLLNYIDDWLICANSAQEVALHTKVTIAHLQTLGFSLNWEKSVLVPSQQITYIGVSLDSTTMMAHLSQERIDNFLSCLALFQCGRKITYQTCMKMSGLMASAIYLIRLSRLSMRPFQRWMLSLQVPPSQGGRIVTVSQHCMATLAPWTAPSFLSQGVRMGEVVSRKLITTDASLSGWGATFEGRTARGLWSQELQTNHINYLELMAIFLAVQHFEQWIVGCHVLIRTDNTTAMCYVNKQGGLSSPVLDRLACELTLWCAPRLMSIQAVHIAGLHNTGADLLSRGQPRYADWSLNPKVARQIWIRFGHPQVDLFANEKNTKCPMFFSIQGTPSLGLDALAHKWPQDLLYAFPPLELIPPTLERTRTQNLKILLVAPAWGTWRSLIAPLLYAQPWPLPPLRDLLTQAGNEIFHPNPESLDLWVWPVWGRS